MRAAYARERGSEGVDHGVRAEASHRLGGK